MSCPSLSLVKYWSFMEIKGLRIRYCILLVEFGNFSHLIKCVWLPFSTEYILSEKWIRTLLFRFFGEYNNFQVPIRVRIAFFRAGIWSFSVLRALVSVLSVLSFAWLLCCSFNHLSLLSLLSYGFASNVNYITSFSSNLK